MVLLCWLVTWFEDEVGENAELCDVNANCLVKWVSSGDRWNEIVTFDQNSLKITTASKTTRQQLWNEHCLYTSTWCFWLFQLFLRWGWAAADRLHRVVQHLKTCPTLACRHVDPFSTFSTFGMSLLSRCPSASLTPWPPGPRETCLEAAHFFRDPIRAEHWQKKALEIHEDWGFLVGRWGYLWHEELRKMSWKMATSIQHWKLSWMIFLF